MKLSDPIRIDNSSFSEPEHPECPTCGEFLPTDYLGRVDGECPYCALPPRRRSGWLPMLLWCSVMALIGVLLTKFIFGEPTPKPELPKLLIAGGVHGNAWMEIRRADTKAPEQRGFDPSYTYILCDYKPKVKKLPNGRWEIQFVSELTEEGGGLP